MLIPTFNRADFLSECIDSILTQSLTPSQVLVVNDGSTDRTQQVLDAYGNDVEIVEEAHKGKPAALNAGLPVVTGEYLWIFDDDDVALPDAVERFVEPLEASPEYGFTYSSFYYTATEAGSTRLGPVVGMSTVPDVDEQGFLVALLESNFLGGAALFARRSCYETVGEFDQELLRSQDYDMAIRSPASSPACGWLARQPFTTASMMASGGRIETASMPRNDSPSGFSTTRSSSVASTGNSHSSTICRSGATWTNCGAKPTSSD